MRRCRSTEFAKGSGVQCTRPSGHNGWHKNQSGDPEAWWRQKRRKKRHATEATGEGGEK